MKKRLVSATCILLILSLCGCAADTVLASATTAAPSAPAVTVSPSGEVTISSTEMPVPTESAIIQGQLPQFSVDENMAWREKTKENIINFLENGYDKNDESLLPYGGDSMALELGIMSEGSGGIYNGAICQTYFLGGETRDYRWCVYLGCEDKESNRFVFPAQFDWTGKGIYTYSIENGDTFCEAMGNMSGVPFCIYDQEDAGVFEKILGDRQNRPLNIGFIVSPIADFNSFYDQIGRVFGGYEDITKNFYDGFVKSGDTMKEILLLTNNCNKQGVSLYEGNGIGVSSYAGTLPILTSDNLAEFDILFDSFSSEEFPLIEVLFFR